jgi:hypothetical protein
MKKFTLPGPKAATAPKLPRPKAPAPPVRKPRGKRAY